MPRAPANNSRKPYDRPAPRSKAPEGAWKHDMAPDAPRAPRAQNGGQSALSAAQNTKLVVSNLHYELTVKDLAAIFGQIGTLVREPLIRYDRSGRSSGVAIVSFETPAEATRAKKQFEGILAKGQPMSIAYDTAPPPRRRTSAPGSFSLLSRVEKPPLLDRLARNEESAARGGGPGPVRTKAKGRRSAGDARPRKAAPKTAADLDKELDAFMGDSTKPQDAAPTSAPANGSEDVEMA